MSLQHRLMSLYRHDCSYGARNVSDLARLALQRVIAQLPVEVELRAKVRELDQRISAVEVDIAHLLERNKVMAGDLGVSQRTVEIHRSRVMEKMEARSLAQLVRMMLELEQRGE